VAIAIALVVDVIMWRISLRADETMIYRIGLQDKEIARLNRVLEIHGKRLVELGERGEK
jgi:hypothetical protein